MRKILAKILFSVFLLVCSGIGKCQEEISHMVILPLYFTQLLIMTIAGNKMVGQMVCWFDSTLQFMLQCYGKMRTSALMLLTSKATYAFSNLTFTFCLYPYYCTYTFLYTFLIIMLFYCVFTQFGQSTSVSKGGFQLLALFPLRKHIKLLMFEELFST